MAKHVIITNDTENNILQLDTAQTACPGMLYNSTDTNKMWFGATDGSLVGPIVVGEVIVSQGIYNSDFEAGQGGLAVGDWYECGEAHDEGAVAGTLKKRKV